MAKAKVKRLTEKEQAALQELLELAAAQILALKRKPKRGYQGNLEVEDVIIVVKAKGSDGNMYYIDPDEITDADPDVFAREYVRVPAKQGGGFSVLDLFEKFLPLVNPAAGGILSGLKGIFKKG